MGAWKEGDRGTRRFPGREASSIDHYITVDRARLRQMANAAQEAPHAGTATTRRPSRIGLWGSLWELFLLHFNPLRM
jgi:hypothetical protein